MRRVKRLGDLFAFRVDRDRQAETRGFPHAFVEREIVGARKFRQSGIAQKRLESDRRRVPPDRPSRAAVAGTMPPHSAKSVIDARFERGAFCSRIRCALTVQGDEFSGMSKNSVPPPAASARLPVAAPSQSVRPGSLKCRWTSIRPGRMVSPRASISCFAASGDCGTDCR